jgi:acyl carrier protein
MAHSYTRNELVTLVSEVLSSTVPDCDAPTPDTALIGESAAIDSVALITLLIGVEERLGGAVDLAASLMAFPDADALDHPFRTIGSLATHLHAQLSSDVTGESMPGE